MFRVLTIPLVSSLLACGSLGTSDAPAFNSQLRAEWSTFADALVDLDADPALADMTLSDRTHPNEDGHERIAVHFAATLRDLLIDAGAL